MIDAELFLYLALSTVVMLALLAKWLIHRTRVSAEAAVESEDIVPVSAEAAADLGTTVITSDTGAKVYTQPQR